MPLPPAITDLEQLKDHPAVARLLAWNPSAVEGAKFDRDEMTYLPGAIVASAMPALCCATIPIAHSIFSPT